MMIFVGSSWQCMRNARLQTHAAIKQDINMSISAQAKLLKDQAQRLQERTSFANSQQSHNSEGFFFRGVPMQSKVWYCIFHGILEVIYIQHSWLQHTSSRRGNLQLLCFQEKTLFDVVSFSQCDINIPHNLQHIWDTDLQLQHVYVPSQTSDIFLRICKTVKLMMILSVTCQCYQSLSHSNALIPGYQVKEHMFATRRSRPLKRRQRS